MISVENYHNTHTLRIYKMENFLMGTIQLQDNRILQSDEASSDDRAERQAKKRHSRIVNKLKKSGFDSDELSRDMMILKNPDNYQRIIQQQLSNIEVKPEGNVNKLPYLKSFVDGLNLSEGILDNLKRCDINDPTPIQMVAIPYILNKHDVVVQSEAGSGKTFAFLLPIISRILELKSGQSGQRGYATNSTSPYGIIVAPTHELVLQIACDATRLVQNQHNIGVSFTMGGLDSRCTKEVFSQGCDILVCTAGRLYSHFKNGYKPLDTKNLKFIVLDEADKLLTSNTGSNGYDDENMQSDKFLFDFIVNKLSTDVNCKDDFHVLLFSATVDLYKYSQLLVRDNTVFVRVGDKYPSSTIKQHFVHIKHKSEKDDRLMEIIDSIAFHFNNLSQKTESNARNKIGKTIIFCNERRNADRLAHSLITKGYLAAAIHSNRSHKQRYEAMRNLKAGALDVLVASDVLARGINVPHVDYVINYDLPHYFNSEEYLHRVGRCGRVGNIGCAITLFDPNVDYKAAPILIEGLQFHNQEVPEILLECEYHHNNCYNQQMHFRRRAPVPSNERTQRSESNSTDDSGYST